MRRDWPAEAQSFRETVADALAALGGVGVARDAEEEPRSRVTKVEPVLEQLGVLTLDLWGEEAESAALALAVAEAGAVVLPWPLVHQLSVPAVAREQADAFYLTDGTERHLDHADLFERAVTFEIGHSAGRRVVAGEQAGAPLDPFAVTVERSDTVRLTDVRSAVAAHYLLDAFWAGGALRTAVRLAARHARDRTQFGVPIGRFGEIRWRLADMVLARDGLEELTLHTWWAARQGRAGVVDLLALRLTMIEAATSVLSHGHQVLAAMGLCEEHDLAVVDRHLQPVLHRPGGALRTNRWLAESVAADGFDATFAVAPWTV